MLGQIHSPTARWQLGRQRSWTHQPQAILKRRVEKLLIDDSCVAPAGYAPVIIERVGKRKYVIRHGSNRVAIGGKGKGALADVIAAVLRHPMLAPDWKPASDKPFQILLPLHD